MDDYVQAILRLATKSGRATAERLETRTTRQTQRQNHVDISDAALGHMVEMELEKRTQGSSSSSSQLSTSQKRRS